MIEAPRRASRCHVSQTAALGHFPTVTLSATCGPCHGSDGAGMPHAVLCCAGPLECAAEAGRKRVRERPQGLGGDEGERSRQDRRRGGGVQRQLARLTHRKPHGPLTRGGCGARAVGPGHSCHRATLLWLLRCRLLRIGCRFSCPWNRRLPLEQPRPGALPSASFLDDYRTVHMPDSSRQAGHAGLRQNCVAGMCECSVGGGAERRCRDASGHGNRGIVSRAYVDLMCRTRRCLHGCSGVVVGVWHAAWCPVAGLRWWHAVGDAWTVFVSTWARGRQQGVELLGAALRRTCRCRPAGVSAFVARRLWRDGSEQTEQNHLATVREVNGGRPCHSPVPWSGVWCSWGASSCRIGMYRAGMPRDSGLHVLSSHQATTSAKRAFLSMVTS